VTKGRIAAFAAALRRAGFDVVLPFSTAAYDAARPEGFDPLPRFGRPDALGVLVANTRRLWPRLLDTLARDAALAAAEHPLDRYTEQAVHAAAARLDPLRRQVRFAHDAGPRRVAMVAAAVATGRAARAPTGLAVHDAYGPWWALRAVVVVDTPPVPTVRPEAAPPCADCPAPCRAPAEALAARWAAAGATDGRAFVRRHFTDLVAARDACPVGRAHRYTNDQIRYHYLHDRRLLVQSAGHQ